MQANIITTKLTILAAVGMLLSLAGGAGAQTNSYTIAVNAPIADGSPVGLASTTAVSGLSGSISSIEVNLDITGGFNGDLYAYLAGPQGGFAILLNRVGLGSSNPFGYSDAGFNITLSSGYANIHNYQSGSYTLTGGELWAPDGRNISPLSAPSAFDSAATTADFGSFTGLIPNGDWTLFVADLSSGGQSTLVNWGLTIVTVPEPQTWLLGFGGVLLFALNRRRKA